MSGTQIGYLKGKLGLRGKTQPGDMIQRMNKAKTNNISNIISKKSDIIKKSNRLSKITII